LAVALVVLLVYRGSTITDDSLLLQSFTATISREGKDATISLSSYGGTTTTTSTKTTTTTTSEARKKEGGEKVASSTSKTIRPITDPIKLRQLKNYQTGKALLLNLHPTHHGGTSFCSIIGRTGGPVASPNYPEDAPSFACWQDKDKLTQAKYSFFTKARFLATTPVSHDETGTYIQALRPHFHMTSWEYDGVDEMKHNVSATDWDHPHLASVAITREPLSRLLASGSFVSRWYPGYNKRSLSHEGWWDYATNPKRQQTDNFFLRILEGSPRAHGNPMRKNERHHQKQKDPKKDEPEYLYTPETLPSLETLKHTFDLEKRQYERAVEILNRFTIVLDIACLDDGFAALTDLLGLNKTTVDAKRAKSSKRRAASSHEHSEKKGTPKERIGYEDVYDYLVEKHKWDIELYEYSKTISLVDCSS
jgi:hypothetical protein